MDTLPHIEITATQFRLVTVAPVDPTSPLSALKVSGSDRKDLIELLNKEAQRVVDEHGFAIKSGATKVPHKESICALRIQKRLGF